MITYHKFGLKARAYKNKKLAPIVKFIKRKTGIKSNQISLTGGILGISSGFFVIVDHATFIILIILTIISDIFDGAFAAQENRKKEGWLIDSTIDRLATISILAGITVNYFSREWLFLLLVFILINAFVVYRKNHFNGKIKSIDWDIPAYIAFIFEYYTVGAIVLGVSLFLSSLYVTIWPLKIKLGRS